MKTLQLANVIIVAILITGCSTTTKTSRREAAALVSKVAKYRQDQQARIDTLNSDYQKTYARLMAELETVYDFEADQSLDLGSMKVAEDLLSKWEDTTLQKQFRDTFSQTLDDNLKAMQAADSALQQARTTYANSYKDAVLQLKKLDQVKSDLDTVASKPSDAKQLNELLQTLYAIYEKSQKTTNSPAK